jgi:hypothetical protein
MDASRSDARVFFGDALDAGTYGFQGLKRKRPRPSDLGRAEQSRQ